MKQPETPCKGSENGSPSIRYPMPSKMVCAREIDGVA